MKKIIFAIGLLLPVTILHAQPPHPPKPPGIEERINRTQEILQHEVQPTTAQQTAIATVFKTFFTAEDQLRKDNPPPLPPPPDPKVKAAMDQLAKERDAAIKKILTEAQYAKYQEAAKKLHPPKAGGPVDRNSMPNEIN